jgi:hypothetical protein
MKNYKTSMTLFIEFLEKAKADKQEFDYDILIAFATELKDTNEKYDLIKAFVGNYDSNISNEELQEKVNKGKKYYEDTYQNTQL